jgi:hypothetical protein
MEQAKHTPVKWLQQDKHSIFVGRILNSEFENIGVNPLHVLTTWTWAFPCPLPSVFLNSFLCAPFVKYRSVFWDQPFCLEELCCVGVFMATCNMVADWRERPSLLLTVWSTSRRTSVQGFWAFDYNSSLAASGCFLHLDNWILWNLLQKMIHWKLARFKQTCSQFLFLETCDSNGGKGTDMCYDM